MLERVLPAFGWLRRYRRGDLAGDLSAGLTVAVMLVPQGMAYATLAGLPPVAGLYASVVPLFAYALFGSSRQLAVGPVAIVSLLTLSGVSAVAEPGSGEFVALAALLALIVGAIQFGLGLLRAGFLANFLSRAVVSGFTSAAAVVIGLSQLGHLLGVELGAGHGVLALLWEAGTRLGEVNPPTLAVGAGSLAALVLFRRFSPRFPAPLLAVAASALVVYAFGLDERGVGVVGEVPGGLPGLSLPALDPGSVVALIPTALTIAFVGFVESIAVARSIAAKERYDIDANRELVGLGLANVLGSAFSAYPVTGGLSRSAVNYGAGARTPLASVVTAGLVVLTLVLLTPLFYYLPNATLAAIVMVAVYGLIDAVEPVRLFKVKPADAWALVVTFVATLLVGIERGIVAGIAFSLVVFVWRSSRPHTTEVGYLPDEDVFRNVNRYPGARTFPGVLIVRVDASLYFANMAFLKNWIDGAISARPGLRHLILDFSAVNDVDAVAVETLEDLATQLRSRGISTHVAGMKGPVRDVAGRSAWPEELGADAAHPSVKHALGRLNLWHGPNATELSAS